MNAIARILLTGFAAALCSCSYIQDYSLRIEGMKIEMLDLKGTQARIYAKPGNDLNYFSIGVFPKEQIDAMGKDRLIPYLNSCLDSLYSNSSPDVNDYKKLRNYYEELGHHYIGDYSDFFLYFAEASLIVVDLTPQTDYYVVGGCVDPVARKVVGQPYLYQFRTTEILPDASPMVLEYMVHDTPGNFYYYAKPTLEGRICRDLYLYGIVSKTELDREPYCGDINKYAASVYLSYVAEGSVASALQWDISRQDDISVHLNDRTQPNETYIIFGAPYNIKNLEMLYTYTFTYTPGMSTDYANDQLVR